MVASHYTWEKGGILPKLLRHSAVKHTLLYDYLVDYFLTLVSSPHQDHIKLTIVDGFCGGGKYTNEENNEVPGSPIVILKAIKEAESRIVMSQQRKKPLVLDVELICIDTDKHALDHLKWVLEQEGYGNLLKNETIKLLKGTFSSHSDNVIKRCKERSKYSGKAIFVLDQYGYSEVPSSALRSIFNELAKAEVILTFNVDSLITYLNEQNLLNFEAKTGFDGSITASELDELQKNPNWRKVIQSRLYKSITQDTGAKFFTPFFVRPQKGHGDFWLLHLSQHSKARDVMTNTHWKHNNHFIHYGDAGLDMFGVGYAAVIDKDILTQNSFEFDNVAAQRSQTSMLEEIPRYFNQITEPLPFGKFFESKCNSTPATRDMIEEAVLKLSQENEVQILTTDLRVSKVTTSIHDSHLIRKNPQQRFW